MANDWGIDHQINCGCRPCGVGAKPVSIKSSVVSLVETSAVVGESPAWRVKLFVFGAALKSRVLWDWSVKRVVIFIEKQARSGDR